jgi:hypothetical protein
MELLLNLVWFAGSLMALSSFVQRRRESVWTARVPHHKALLAIACALVLLFPVVSASDDLHPTQAVLEDASKRIHQISADLQDVPARVPMGMLPALIAACLLTLLLVLQWRNRSTDAICLATRPRTPGDGRSPPQF